MEKEARFIHTSLPEIPLDNQAVFELLKTIFSILSFILLYIHIYKTIWWLPFSHTPFALNFYLMDFNLVIYIMTILLKPSVIAFIMEVKLGSYSDNIILILLLIVCKTILATFVGSMNMFSFYAIFQTYDTLRLLFLIYPFFIYISLYYNHSHKKKMIAAIVKGTRLIHSMFCHIDEPVIPNCLKNFQEKYESQHDSFELIHNCSECLSNARTVHEEAEQIKRSLASTTKDILYQSTMATYYSCFLPCVLAPTVIHFDAYGVSHLTFIVWITTLIHYVYQRLPYTTVDKIHQVTQHLGTWTFVKRLPTTPFVNGHPSVASITFYSGSRISAYSNDVYWNAGSLVRCGDKIYRAKEAFDVSDPSSYFHSFLYVIFYRPLRFISSLFCIQLWSVMFQMYSLYLHTEWNHVLSLGLLLFCNYYLLFKISRDFFTLSRTYTNARRTHKRKQEMTADSKKSD